MKFTSVFLIVTLLSIGAKAQSNEKILGFFKTKNVDSIIKYCELPFTLSVGSMFDDANIKDANILKDKFQKLFKQNYFSSFLKGKKVGDTKNSVNLQTHSYNKDGEMESESSMMFNFKNNKEGKRRLYQIFMAG